MQPGDILRKRYKIIEQIGGGGFGDTYRASDLDFPGERQCVVKHLSPKNSEPQAVAIAKRLFKTEAKCLSRLGEHDRIPRLYADIEEDGQFYLVEEFIEGHSLNSEFQQGTRWSETETADFLQELLEILAFVHQEGTIHRDIKPDNIMRRDRDQKLVLIDFGAVKEKLTVDESGQPTVVIGTPSYMAPEQAIGQPGTYSDVYAVGMLGIQTLTGLASYDLPRDEDRLRQKIDELPINTQLKYVLGHMVSFQYKNRFSDAAKALQALVLTIVEPVTRKSNPFPNDIVESPTVTSNLPKKLLLTLLGAIALIGSGIYASGVFNQPNFAQLETFLQNKQWQQADEETDRLLLKIARENKALDAESIANFPCKSLSKIDRLWTDNSNGRFGFSPQKQAYLETGNQIGQYIESTYEAFGKSVGWRTFGYWSLSGDLKFTDIAPMGHLPSPGKEAKERQDLRWRERGMLLSRVDECGL